MKIKELLKPDVKKILLAVILAVIFTPVKFDAPECDAILVLGPCPYETTTIISVAMIENFDRFMAHRTEWLNIQFIIFGILFYIISCSIFYFFKGKKGRKKRPFQASTG